MQNSKTRYAWLYSLWLILLFSTSMVSATVSANDDFDQQLTKLQSKSFAQKANAIEAIANSHHEMAVPLLEAIANNALYLTKENHVWVEGQADGQGIRITELTTRLPLGVVNENALTFFVSNNQLRANARYALALMNLDHENDTYRLQAVYHLRQHTNIDILIKFQQALQQETNGQIKKLLQESIDIITISTSNDTEEKLTAIKRLGNGLSTEARNALQSLLQQDESGLYVITDTKITQAAELALLSLDRSRKINSWFENAFFGLSAGSILLLTAMGLAITFGVMGVINMAHGEMIMIGAYTTYLMQQLMPNFLGLSMALAIPIAFISAALVGILIERTVIKHLYGRPLETLLATFGISLILQQLARSISSPLNKEVSTPEFMSGALQINDALSLTYNRIFIVIGTLIVFFMVLYLMKKTSLGLQVRAVMQNRNMAKAMGINTDRINMLTFGFGSGLAGIAGVALSQLTNVGPNLGQSFIVDSFMVVVFGGVGNLWGTLVAAFSLGEMNKLLEPEIGAVLAKVLILLLIILFIQKRPRGIFPQKGRDTEV